MLLEIFYTSMLVFGMCIYSSFSQELLYPPDQFLFVAISDLQ